ncbi:MAG: DUF6585 family protein [Chloroflexota bacterium]
MTDDAKSLFQKGVEAIRDQQDAAAGRKFLQQSLQLEPQNDVAWVWLSYTVSDPQKKLGCLKRALQINPANAQALKLKQKLEKATSPAAGGIQTATPLPTQSGAADLGNLLGSARLNPWLLAVKIVSVVICAVAVVAMGIGLVLFRRYYPTGIGLPINEVFGGILILALIGLVFFMYTIIWPSNVQIEIYEKGVQQTKHGESHSWRWEEFTAIRIAEQTVIHTAYCIPVFREHTYICRVLIDKKVVLKIDKDFQKYKEAGTLIAQKTAPIFFERDLKRYDSGESLRYGTIELNHEGIRDIWKFWKSTTWRDIEKYDVDGPWLKIKRFERPGVNFYLLDLPNLVSFLKMIDKMTA